MSQSAFDPNAEMAELFETQLKIANLQAAARSSTCKRDFCQNLEQRLAGAS